MDDSHREAPTHQELSLGLTSPTPVLCGAGVVPVGLGRVRATWSQLYSQLNEEQCKDELSPGRSKRGSRTWKKKQKHVK